MHYLQNKEKGTEFWKRILGLPQTHWTKWAEGNWDTVAVSNFYVV